MIFDESDYDDSDVELSDSDIDMDTRSMERNTKVKGCSKAGITIKAKKKNKKIIKKKMKKKEVKNKIRKAGKDVFIDCFETFDAFKLKYIIDNFDNEFKDKLRWRERYDKYPPLKIITNYMYSGVQGRTSSRVNYIRYKQKKRLGRFQATSPSLQGIPREIRHSIAGEFYHDIDVVNAHPVILKWMCSVKGFTCEYLEKYINNRDKILAKLVAKNDIDRDSAKRIYLTITNGGYEDYKEVENKTTHLKKYRVEMKRLHLLFAQINPERLKEVKKKRIADGKDYNHEAGLMNSLMLDVESDILTVIYEFFGRPDDCVLCFDGLMIRKAKELPNLERIENIINEKLDIEVKLKIKPMLEGFDFPDSKQSKPLDFDIDEDYYWADFMDGTKDIFPTIEDLKSYFIENINRVMFRVYSGDYYVRKLSKGQQFYIDTKIPHEVFSYWDIKRQKNGGYTSILRNKTMKTYMEELGLLKHLKTYNKLTFDPSLKHDRREFNLWTGFQAKLLDIEEVRESKCKLILDAIHDIWAGGDDSRYKYVLSWFHNMFKYPEKKNKVVLILNSDDKQVGKGIIINHFLIPYVFGHRCSMTTVGLDTVLSKFNEILMNKLFINCEELASTSGFNDKFDRFKSQITEPIINIEIKGGKIFPYPDLTNYIGCTNHRTSIKVEKGDARFCILECDSCHKNDFVYFDKLAETFNDETANNFFSYIYYMEDLPELRHIPKTDLRTEMIKNSVSAPIRFLIDIEELLEEKLAKDDFEFTDWQYEILKENQIRGSNFYSTYRKYCDTNNERMLSIQKFGRDIRGYIDKDKINKWIYYKLDTIKVDLK